MGNKENSGKVLFQTIFSSWVAIIHAFKYVKCVWYSKYTNYLFMLFIFLWMRRFYYHKWIEYKVQVSAPKNKTGAPVYTPTPTDIQRKTIN